MGLLEKLNRMIVGPPIEEVAESPLLKRDVGPLEGTRMSLWNSIIPNWWSQNGMNPNQWWTPGDGRLAERVWVCNRCMQLNAQQIAGMPMKFVGTTTPEWVSSPDQNWYPNGITDVMFSIVWQMYAWGFAVLYVTNYYADGYPRNFTVLDSCYLTITRNRETGEREFKIGDVELDPDRCIQIDRDPHGQAHGSSALASYAQQAWSLLAAGNTSMSVSQGGYPKVYLASQRKLGEGQAAAIQQEWMEKTQQRGGAPPVTPPEIVPTELNFNPSDLALLDTQKWNAEVLCTAYGVPSVLLNMALQGGLTYQNPGALGEMWWRFELRPIGKRIVDAFTARLLPSGQYVWLDATDTFLPFSTPAAGPLADDTNDTEVQADPQATPTSTASPGPQQPRLAAVGGGYT